MRQVLFEIPLNNLIEGLPNVPVYGYGAMLFVAFIVCTILGSRLAMREGIARERVQDLALWIFIFGIIGARINYMVNEYPRVPITDFFLLWDGGLVFYGSAIGGVVGYLLYYLVVLRKYNISSWKMADLIAPCGALGLAVGRFGCLLNGCCYGNVACGDWDSARIKVALLDGNVACAGCPAVEFPLSAPPRHHMVQMGYQTAAGFTVTDKNPRVVEMVEPNSPAARAGLEPWDYISRVNDKPSSPGEVLSQGEWPRGKTDLVLSVQRGDKMLELPAFEPLTVGLHPTQLYESISMFLLLWLLLAYYPLRRRDGELMVLFMLCYAVHRFFNEMLRTDTNPVWGTGMTYSQNISIILLAGGLFLGWLVWRKPVQYHRAFNPPHVGSDHHLHVKTSPSPIPK